MKPNVFMKSEFRDLRRFSHRIPLNRRAAGFLLRNSHACVKAVDQVCIAKKCYKVITVKA